MSNSAAFFNTKGYNLAAWGKILEHNLYRKAIMIANGGTEPIKFGFGTNSVEADSVTLRPGDIMKFDKMVPIEQLWGVGYLVIGEVM